MHIRRHGRHEHVFSYLYLRDHLRSVFRNARDIDPNITEFVLSRRQVLVHVVVETYVVRRKLNDDGRFASRKPYAERKRASARFLPPPVGVLVFYELVVNEFKRKSRVRRKLIRRVQTGTFADGGGKEFAEVYRLLRTEYEIAAQRSRIGVYLAQRFELREIHFRDRHFLSEIDGVQIQSEKHRRRLARRHAHVGVHNDDELLLVNVPGKREVRLFEHDFRADDTEHNGELIHRIRHERVEYVDDLTRRIRTLSRFFEHLLHEFDIHLQRFAVDGENVVFVLFGVTRLVHNVLQRFTVLVGRRRVENTVHDGHDHPVYDLEEFSEYFRKVDMLVVYLREAERGQVYPPVHIRKPRDIEPSPFVTVIHTDHQFPVRYIAEFDEHVVFAVVVLLNVRFDNGVELRVPRRNVQQTVEPVVSVHERLVIQLVQNEIFGITPPVVERNVGNVVVRHVVTRHLTGKREHRVGKDVGRARLVGRNDTLHIRLYLRHESVRHRGELESQKLVRHRVPFSAEHTEQTIQKVGDVFTQSVQRDLIEIKAYVVAVHDALVVFADDAHHRLVDLARACVALQPDRFQKSFDGQTDEKTNELLIQNGVAEFGEAALIPLYIQIKYVSGIFGVAVQPVEIHTDENGVSRAVVPLDAYIRLFDGFVVDLQAAYKFPTAVGGLSFGRFDIFAVFVIIVKRVAEIVFVRERVHIRLHA